MLNYNKELNIHPSWNEFFTPLFKNGTIEKILYNININSNGLTPSKQNIFKAFSIDLNEVKCVLIGEDPYPNPEYNNGIAYAVPKEDDSIALNNFRDELYSTVDPNIQIDDIFDYSLKLWIDQGIMLINSALTTAPFRTSSHWDYWKEFMKYFMNFMDSRDNILFCLLGDQPNFLKKYVCNDKNKYFDCGTPHAYISKKREFMNCDIFMVIDEHFFENHNYNFKWLLERELV